MKTGDHDPISLAERVLGILNEGGFSATYKYALFIAILDLCLEKTSTKGVPPESLTTRQLAEKVVELYWSHAMPYGRHGTLRQGGNRTGQQAEILRAVVEARARWCDTDADTVPRFRVRRPNAYARLLNEVEWKLIEMPIPRLQRLATHEDRFLYDYSWTQDIRQSVVRTYQRLYAAGHEDEARRRSFDNRLLLKPGVPENLVRLNGILRPLFHREWAVMVARMNGLPEAELERFLFGPERTSLEPVRAPLRELQRGRCFYCDDRIAGATDVDHFIPWSRYPDDGLDNLVAAHPKCNNSKRDFLAAEGHVQRWVRRRLECAADLDAVAAGVNWFRAPDKTAAVASAIYLALAAGAQLWVAPGEFTLSKPDRLRAILSSPS